MSTAPEIARLEERLENEKWSYLAAMGWKMTCNTPGSFWMWRRDFAKEDAERQARHPATASPFEPYGIIMADTDTAVQMTMRELDMPYLTADELED